MTQPSSLDPNQIVQYKYDDALRADRVVLVGGENINISASLDADAIGKAIASHILIPEQKVSNEIQQLSIPTIIKETSIEKIEVPVIIKETEIKLVEVPKVIIEKQIEIKEIQVPVVTQEVKIIEIYRDKFSSLEKILLAAQVVAMIFVAISYLIKK